jgi:hydroxymethylglutaryl-CoA reductase (NADPH)
MNDFNINDKSESEENRDVSRIPKFPRKEHYTQKAIKARLEWAKHVSGAHLNNITHSIFNPENLAGNIENYIGSVQIPLGIAGPIFIKGMYVNEYMPIPIASTEGALVSSISRGGYTCNICGGIQTHVLRQTMLRAPAFFCKDMQGAINLEKWIMEHIDIIKAKAESVSSIARLQQIVPFLFGDSLHLRFYYTTGDAAGQNMTSACTWVACEWIVKQIRNIPSIKFYYYIIEGNMSGDKKVNIQNSIMGRGVAVTAQCYIPDKVLREVLRIPAKRLIRAWIEAEVGAQQIGMVGINVNFANVIAGVFTSTGQDIACVHESSSGTFKMREENEGILFTAHLPSLIIGTIGGGTKLPTQRDCLELMGCYGTGKLFRLAEIITATCLALDISTASAIVANEFVRAHENLGRNRPSEKLFSVQINEKFINNMVFNKETIVEKLTKEKIEKHSGIISEIIQEKSHDIYGLFRCALTIRKMQGIEKISAILKNKASDNEIIDIGINLAKLSGEDTLPGLFESQNHFWFSQLSHQRD